MDNLDDLLTEEVLELVNRAVQKRHLNMLRIENLADYNEARTDMQKTKIYADCFSKTSKIIMDKYIESLKDNKRDVTLLVDANKLSEYADFYYEEAQMYKNTIDEYLLYLRDGHVIDAFLGKSRED